MRKIIIVALAMWMVSCTTSAPVAEVKPKPVKKIYRLTGTNKDGKKIIFGNF